MRKFIQKLFLGKPEYNVKIGQNAYASNYQNLRNVWNNQNHHDIGFEKILRLFLISVQFIFPGLHIRYLFGKMGLIVRNVAIEFYVLSKTVLPLLFIFTGWYHYKITVCISVYLLIETLCYVASLIFVSDSTLKPRSYRRNILMLFFNFLEIVFSFAVIYAGLGLLEGAKIEGIDYIYFSIVTSTTIGYGDLHTYSNLGKIVVSMQAFVSLTFVVLFLNFFGSKVETMYNEGD